MISSSILDEITPEMERQILRELEKLGVLVTCESCGKCEYTPGALSACLTTVRGNGICGKSLMKAKTTA